MLKVISNQPKRGVGSRGDEGDEGDGEMGRWGGGQMREKVILLSPHLPMPLSPHPLSIPNAPCPMPKNSYLKPSCKPQLSITALIAVNQT